MSTAIESSVRIDAEPGVVFEALTSPELVRRWLCHEAEIEPRSGGRYDLHWSATDRGAEVRYSGSAEITALEPARRLTLRLDPADGPSPESVIEFHIEPDSGASQLRLRQTGFVAGDAGRRQRDAYARGWSSCLTVLRSLLEDEPGARLAPAPMHRDLPLPGQDPCGIAWDGSHLWVSDSGRGRIFRLDPFTGQTLGSFAFEGEPSGLVFDGENLWQAEREERVVVKLSRDGKVLKRLEASHVRGELTGLAWDGQHLWMGDDSEDESRALKVHPRSGIVYHKVAAPAGLSGLAWDGDKLWVANFEGRSVQRLDPQSGEVLLRVALKGHPAGLAWDGERLWYADSEWKLASRVLDPLVG